MPHTTNSLVILPTADEIHPQELIVPTAYIHSKMALFASTLCQSSCLCHLQPWYPQSLQLANCISLSCYTAFSSEHFSKTQDLFMHLFNQTWHILQLTHSLVILPMDHGWDALAIAFPTAHGACSPLFSSSLLDALVSLVCCLWPYPECVSKSPYVAMLYWLRLWPPCFFQQFPILHTL